MVQTLDAAARRDALDSLPGWAEAAGRDALVRGYRFKDFADAFAFMTRCALAADRMDHHPEWTNVYNRVEVTLATHEAGGVTERDIALARVMDAAAAALGGR